MRSERLWAGVRIAATVILFGASTWRPASAQTTLVLSAPGTQVTDSVMVQAGASANTNFGTLDYVATRASSTPDYLRRALFKFDTQNTIPAKSRIWSAILTVTVKYSGDDAVRTIGVYPVTSSFVQGEATWNLRRAATPWTTPGGDLGAMSVQQSVTNVVGSKVSFDLTAIVQGAVNSSSSRYTRVALADLGASASTSYREYYSMKAADPSARPVLTVVYGGDAPNPAPTPAPGVKLRVLQYNTHHGGYGTDGVYSPERIVSWVVKADPDIVSLQEIEMFDSWSLNQDQAALYQSKLQQATGAVWYKQWFGRAGATTGLGQLILSKYPFAAVATKLLTASRSAIDASIVVNGRTINFTSVHLDNLYQSNRLKEIAELLPWETTLVENRIIVGDFNAWPDTTEVANMDQTYIDTWPAAQALGTAVGNGITHGSHRIDYVFQSKGATALGLEGQTIYNTADANGVMPSDHNPVLTVFTVR